MQSKPLELLFDAVHHGKYDFEDFLNGDLTSHYSPVQIGRRTLYRPDKKLKAYLTFLNTFVFEHLLLNDRAVYSYRKGVNPHEAVHVHASNRAFFQTDIEDFFREHQSHDCKKKLLLRNLIGFPYPTFTSMWREFST